VLTPVDKDQPFWSTRMANGITDAGTFLTLGFAAKGLSSAKSLAITEQTPLMRRVVRGAAVGSASGLPAGFAHAELHSITNGKGLAGASEVAGDMAGFALFGGILGGAHGGATNSRLAKFVETYRSERGNITGADAKVAAEQPSAYTRFDSGRSNRPAEKGQPTEKAEPAENMAAAPAEKILSVKRNSLLGQGDEGKVYSNGDGTVTKVYDNKSADLQAVKATFEKLQSIGVRTPKIYEIGKTEDGRPAMRMQQIGDGDNLSFQLITGEIPPRDLPALSEQYWGFAKKLQDAGIRIDWQLKNMRFEEGKLYILDPSYMKNEPQSALIVEMFGKSIPRPAGDAQ